jgi:hypothetical protein
MKDGSVVRLSDLAEITARHNVIERDLGCVRKSGYIGKYLVRFLDFDRSNVLEDNSEERLMTRNKTDWAQLAMLFESEGCFHIAKQFQHRSNCFGYRLDMVVCMAAPKIMKWLVENFGGTVRNKGKDKRYKNAKTLFEWKPMGEKARKEILLLGMLPYLHDKKDQAVVCLAFVRAPWGGEYKEPLYQICRDLKRESVETNTPDSNIEMIESELISNDKNEFAVMQVS